MIEQQIPVPILYCMCEVVMKQSITDAQLFTTPGGDTNSSSSTAGTSIQFDGYLRDNLHLASQSKVRCDTMTQSAVLRNKPLIMFVGSLQVKGKSSMLGKLYKKQSFNTVEKNKPNPLHETSVDLIYLSQRQNVNYHVLDVHGAINDSRFGLCSTNNNNDNNDNNNGTNHNSNNNDNGTSKMDCLVGLSSLCQVIIIEITQSQLKSGPKMKNFLTKRKIPKTKFQMENVISGKTASDALNFYQRIIVKHFVFIMHVPFCIFLFFLFNPNS